MMILLFEFELRESMGYRRNLASAFRSHIINSRQTDNVSALAPVRLLGSTSFLYMRHNDVYILAVTKNNANAMSTFYFMNSVRLLRFKGEWPQNLLTMLRMSGSQVPAILAREHC